MGVCDICNEPVKEGEGYLLHGKLVARANYMAEVTRRSATMFGMSPEEMQANLMAKARVDTTPWMACEECISHFLGTQEEKFKAHDLAKRYWQGESISLDLLPTTSSLFEEVKKAEGPKKTMVCRACGKEVDYDENLRACPHCMTYDPGWVMVMPGTKDPRAQKHKEKAGDYYAQGLKREAISEFQRAAEIDPSDATVYNNIGAIYGELAEYDEAIRYLRKALEIDPDLGPAKRQLQRIEEILSRRGASQEEPKEEEKRPVIPPEVEEEPRAPEPSREETGLPLWADVSRDPLLVNPLILEKLQKSMCFMVRDETGPVAALIICASPDEFRAPLTAETPMSLYIHYYKAPTFDLYGVYPIVWDDPQEPFFKETWLVGAGRVTGPPDPLAQGQLSRLEALLSQEYTYFLIVDRSNRLVAAQRVDYSPETQEHFLGLLPKARPAQSVTISNVELISGLQGYMNQVSLEEVREAARRLLAVEAEPKEDEIICANCRGIFRWDDAYNQQDTPGSYKYNPPGHGDFRPRAFCPRCGFLVAEWDIDRYADRDRWRWHGTNAELNQDKPLPPGPLTLWGKPVPLHAKPITEEKFVDLSKVRALLRKREDRRARKEKEVAPDDLEGYLERGFLHLEDNELDEAMADFQHCLKLRADYAPAHRGLGWTYYLNRYSGDPKANLDKALSHLREAMRLDPKDGEPHFFLGIIHHNEGEEEEAVAEWRKALELGLPPEKEASAMESLGQHCINRGQLAEAVAHFEKAKELDPSLFIPHTYLRIIYEAWGEGAKAEVERREAERTCRGTSLVPSVEAKVRELASRGRVPSVTPPISLKAMEAKVICPKCGGRNSPAQEVCSQCGADLLPGRSIGERARRFGISMLFIVLAVLLSRVQDLQCLVWLFLILAAFLGGGLVWAFGRTPQYEKYVKRAQRHIEPEPEQALADFTKALELAPEKERAKIFQQRAEICEKLGREPGELDKLVEKPQKPAPPGEAAKATTRALPGRKIFAGITALLGVLFLAGFLFTTAASVHDYIKGLEFERIPFQTQVVIILALLAAFLLFAGLSVFLTERRKIGLLFWSALVALGVIGTGYVMAYVWEGGLLRGALPSVPPTATPVPRFVTFEGDGFSFDYPSNWEVITEKEIDVLLDTSLKGMSPSGYDYIGGVYTGGVDGCRGCAHIVVVSLKDPNLTGTLTDEQYGQVKANYENTMGPRLISIKRTEVSGMPGIEMVNIGRSKDTKLRAVIIIPPEPGIAYSLNCLSHKDSYDDFEAIFSRAMESLRIGGGVPLVTTPSPAAEVITYTIQAGDTLGKIAAEFGVTVEEIVEANDIEDPSLINVGQVLVIPQP